MNRSGIFFLSAWLTLAIQAQAKVDLVTLPERDQVQVTIYNSADLTMVAERRTLTLREGANRLQFSWANTLIDPTSLDMTPLEQAGKVEVQDLVFPPRVKDLGVWNIRSGLRGTVPMEISYFTSGLSWRAFYMGTLAQDEKTMRLQGYVRVTNNTGEDYANAQTRLIVGKVNLLDQIGTLSQRPHPYGRPGATIGAELIDGLALGVKLSTVTAGMGFGFGGGMGGGGSLGKKEIKKEGLSEYFLYTIEGTESIANGWSKRLPSFDTEEIPVENLYKYEEERYGRAAIRFLSFKNDEDHKLGETPIPGGGMKVYLRVDDDAHLSYVGQSSFKYIPVDEDVELNLGAVGDVTVEPELMTYETSDYAFNGHKDVIGWNETWTYRVSVNNTRSVPAEVEIKRNFHTAYWTLSKSGDFGEYEKVDMDTVEFTLTLPPKSKREFDYVLTMRHGTNTETK